MIDLNKIATTIEQIVDNQAKKLSVKDELTDKECVSLEKIARILIILDDRRAKLPVADKYEDVATEDMEAAFD